MGWIGSPRSTRGRVVGVGNIRTAVQLTLTDGRRFALTLDPDEHDLDAIVGRLRQELEPETSSS